jgi:copper oxidase (laccase) domain-containing protein
MDRDTHSKDSAPFEVKVSGLGGFSIRAGFSLGGDPHLPVRIKQVHGKDGRVVFKEQRGLVGEADWIATWESGLPIGVQVADCTAVLVTGWGARGKFVAAIHAGWRSTAARIFDDFVTALQPEGQWWAWMSPRICQQHFEVGPEVIEALGSSADRYCVAGERDRLFLDLGAFQKQQLESLGASVVDHPICSFHQAEFFSYRRSKASERGRHWAWIERQ